MAVGDVNVQVENPVSNDSYFFDGIDDYIELNGGEYFGPHLLNGYSICGWIKLRSTGENQLGRIIAFSGMDVKISGFIASGALVMQVASSTEIATSHLNLNTWYFFVCTQNSSNNCSIYLNNVLSANGDSGAISSLISSGAITVGNAFKGVTRTFHGLIRDLRVYNRVLSSEEMNKLYNNFDVDKESLICWLKLSSDTLDYSKYSHNSQNIGATPYIDVDNIRNLIKAQRVAATDKFLLTDVAGGGVISSEIEGA